MIMRQRAEITAVGQPLGGPPCAASFAATATRRRDVYTRVSKYDSFPAHRADHDSHLRLDGGHRAAGFRVRASGGFQSPAEAARSSLAMGDKLNSSWLQGAARRRLSDHWRSRNRRSGWR